MSKVINLFGKKAPVVEKTQQEKELDRLKTLSDNAHPQDKKLLDSLYDLALEKEAQEREQGVKELEALMEKNRKNDERVRQEKAKKNKAVLRDYRIRT